MIMRARLFDVLFEVEKNIDISDRDIYQSRVYGYLAERLLNVYFLKNQHLEIRELFVKPTDGAYI